MDSNSPDHFQMQPSMIKLKSSDGEVFQVEVKAAKLSMHLKEMFDDLGVIENEVIPIPQNGPVISGQILEKIILWVDHHKDDPAVDEGDEKEQKTTDDISSWDAEFLQVDLATLFQMIQAANYLNIKGLLDGTCKTVAKMIKVMTPVEVRQTFHIHNDFSTEEVERVRKEYAWCEGIDFGGNKEIPIHPVQNVDHENNQVMEDILRNSVVVRRIFQHCPDSDLLKVSFVNKMWNYEARSLLRKRGNLIAHIRCTNDEPCGGNVQAFLSATQQMNIVPFSGINIHIRHVESFRTHHCPNKVPCPFADMILDQLPLRKVSLDLRDKSLNCPGFLLAKKIFQNLSQVLEEVSLKFHITDEEREVIIEDVVQGRGFPSLKILNVRDCYHNSDAPQTAQSIMSLFVSRAPKLQQLIMEGPSASVFNALEGRSDAVLVCTERISAPFDGIWEARIGAVRLENISLMYTGPEFNFERFSRLAPALLRASSTSIRSMQMDPVLAVPFICYGIPLGKIDDLTLRMYYDQLERFEPRYLGILKHLVHFTRIFPNLSKVRICGAFLTNLPPEDTTDRIVERAHAVLPVPPTPGRVANIKTLQFSYGHHLSPATIQFFAEMFPTIEKLDFKAPWGDAIPFSVRSIWEHWPGLKELEIQGKILPNNLNLDCVFCGIFPEEVAELRLKDEEFLKSVHIVPVMPAITCLKNLRVLRLDTFGDDPEQYIDDGNGTFMFSKVTGFIAFKKCPSLAVSLYCQDGFIEVTRHMEPFASVLPSETFLVRVGFGPM